MKERTKTFRFVGGPYDGKTASLQGVPTWFLSTGAKFFDVRPGSSTMPGIRPPQNRSYFADLYEVVPIPGILLYVDPMKHAKVVESRERVSLVFQAEWTGL